ncbi:transcriptional regulator TyrR [Providencia rettgeri]|uniref:HTH-type transcriptional regulatory protein TyrR n=2 Tax=Providencia TaxID=586 RepID=A0AA42FHC5_9GAMM|nr:MULTISPECIES: transcriptional regulator TyrR [Providencia]EIL1984100.1 transcriptional regulator TyrR [Providencia rettgeri]EIU7555264.1 transcriptional regulator TyrR [Providencia rettgeri]EIU7559537.1 transcriptional regulator TyrR [Providencia rettgeri]EIU9516636.1 transcriptional regulator TyrR [Providencia rettgeri]EJD6081966.1 transcriptional regulator TyrR [Providencia rettgeri]
MRLEVTCQDRIGLTRELLDLLVLQNIDLKGIEISPQRKIYLNFTPVDFQVFSTLMAEIRRINGVIDVRRIYFMPSEREHKAVWALLNSFPEPVLSIDNKLNIELVNPMTLQLFGYDETKIREKTFSQLVGSQGLLRWFERESPEPYTEKVVIKGRDYLMQVTPIILADENGKSHCTGAVLLLKSAEILDQQRKQVVEIDKSGFEQIIAVSPVMVNVVERAKRIAMLDEPLLLVGETGTGKDILAKACHLHSARGKEPFLGLNCASMPDDVVESELFGYAAGAYPNAVEGKKGFFEQANGGTVLLDEIAEMSPQMQIKLLRFLNDGTFRRVGEEREVKVNVRVICATQKNLPQLVAEKKFREDLYYRLNVLTLAIPPLRERKEDILPLTKAFVASFSKELHMAEPKLTPSLIEYLGSYDWPGNVRQLRNALYQSLTQLDGHILDADNVQLPTVANTPALALDSLNGSLDEITKRYEASVLSRLYRDYPSTRKLAKRLDISHTAIANKLREYGLNTKKEQD